MKNRLSALDGLRGIAALAVILSHTGFGLDSVTKIPFLIATYKTLAVGPNSVQILFVLSGFLIAYLYPTIQKPLKFIQKRYARIIPVYVVIVLFIWISMYVIHFPSFIAAIFFLVALALIVYGGWNLVTKLKLSSIAGKILFYGYLVLQGLMLLVALFVIPQVTELGQVVLPENIKRIITLLTNLTLTTPFAESLTRISGVFWSLAPEIYFYLLYPFIVIPLITIGKRFGPLVTATIVISMTVILFDLDKAFTGLTGLHSLSIARSSGFVIGVLAGTIYQVKGRIWSTIEKFSGNIIVSLLAILAFIAIQWGDWAVRDGQSIEFMNLYYLISSIVIASLILVSVIPNTLANRVLSTKTLVLLGFISYSSYLIHIQTIEWTHTLPFISLHPLLYPIFSLVLTVIVASILYKCIESLYFNHKKQHTAVTNKFENNTDLLSANRTQDFTGSMLFSYKSIVIVSAIVVASFTYIYSGGYSPTLLVSHHKMTNDSGKLLDHKVSISITSSYSNLSSVVINLEYAKNAEETRQKNKNPAQLFFRLREAGTNKVLFESQRNAYEVEGTPHFPFGFPTILDSANKKYTVELETKQGDINDQVVVDSSATSLTSIYTISKQDILHNPLVPVWNRVTYAFGNPGMVLASVFTILVASTCIYLKRIQRE